MTRRRLKIKERKLGRERARGLYWHGEGLIEIDPNQRSRPYLNTLIHEFLHHICPGRGETWVYKHAGALTKAIWERGYRRLQK